MTNAESFDLFHQVVFPKGTMGQIIIFFKNSFGLSIKTEGNRVGSRQGDVSESRRERQSVWGNRWYKRKPVSDNCLTQHNVQSVRNQLSPVKWVTNKLFDQPFSQVMNSKLIIWPSSSNQHYILPSFVCSPSPFSISCLRKISQRTGWGYYCTKK